MTVADIKWRGPVPLTREDHLIGRADELYELLDHCRSYTIVEVTAASGVGKTSFVNGAMPHLEADSGAVVQRGLPWSAVLREYDSRSGKQSTTDPEEALYRLALAPDAPEAADPDHVLHTLGEAGTRDVIVILDQVEELLRYRPRLGEAFLDLVGRTAAATRVPHVVIARSEFRDRLRYVEVPGNAVWHMLLPEISEKDAIESIIREPALDAEVDIEPEFVSRIADWWIEARARPEHAVDDAIVTADPLVGVGLLHLQALLWSFQRWAKAGSVGSQSTLSIGDLQEFARARTIENLESDDAGEQLIREAVQEYVRTTVDERTYSPKDAWANGPRLMIARVAWQLSSSGFKVPQALSSLLPVALQPELAVHLQPALPARLRRKWTPEELASDFPIEPAGIALDWDPPPSSVTDVMIRALENALNRLAAEDVNVLRTFNPGSDPIYELAHDGVGVALNLWAEQLLGDPVSAIGVVGQRSGHSITQSLDVETFLPSANSPFWGTVKVADDAARVTIRNLRWRGASIGSECFENVTFLDCEFTGTVFIGVTMRNVEFQGCDLRGVAMLYCDMQGVTFDGRRPNAGLDTFTIRSAGAQGTVTFDGVVDTEGLFLTDLHGGNWSFLDCEIEHLVIRSPGEEPMAIRFSDTHLTLATVAVPRGTTIVETGTTRIDLLSDPNGVLEPRSG